ncbi:MAG: hypothetical protein EOO05_16710 [Chitinophagaceae bacterium]|nr:MAG: hypothetical protein EOO05_16710 [Chitinophagaceae bacterium]
MRIGIFSDVHANLPAMEAVMQQLTNAQVDQVYCLGDLIGHHIWPNEVISMVRSAFIPTMLAGTLIDIHQR